MSGEDEVTIASNDKRHINTVISLKDNQTDK